MVIEQATPETIAELHAGLCALVRDAVEGGASIGFVLPLADGELDRYLDGVRADVERDSRIVLARTRRHRVAGMVQLELAAKANARHRAEVQKLIVARRARRRGLGTRLMAEIESAARERGRTLLVLDTISGSEADPLYRGLGYLEAGSIPRYAAMPWGELAPTTVFFKELSRPPATAPGGHTIDPWEFSKGRGGGSRGAARIALDWLVTIAVAVGFVLAFEAEIARPYQIPSSSMEPTLHCARPAVGCRSSFSDRVIACELCYRFSAPERGQVVVFHAPEAAADKCGEGGVYVKRLIGLPGDTVREDGRRLHLDRRQAAR